MSGPTARPSASEDAAEGWSPAPPSPRPDLLEVHVWRVHLRREADELEALRALLSGDERARAKRFRARSDEDEWVAARGSLRRILSRYVGEPPERLRFDYGPHGKPRLTPSPPANPGALRLEFNLSHSADVALVAVAFGRRVGIDVQKTSPVAEDDERISEAWLSTEERQALARADAASRTAAFHAMWTRKEALLKARGEGFSGGLPGALAPDGLHGWTLQALDCGPDYAAALAIEGEGWRLSRWSGG